MPSFGEELRRERELREISLREISEATKVNMRFLEALERNDFSGLPGGVFNKGYVRAYCQHIGVDPENMINAYLLEEQTQDTLDQGPHPSGLLRGRARGEALRGSSSTIGARPAKDPTRRLGAMVAIGLVVALVVTLAWWSASRERVEEPATGASPAAPAEGRP